MGNYYEKCKSALFTDIRLCVHYFRYLTVNTDGDGGDDDDDGVDNLSGKAEKSSTYFFWHTKLAEFFHYHSDAAKMVEEYPYHLACLDDKFHLAQCLCDWRVFDRLYHEEYSSQLMAYWRTVSIIILLKFI